MNSGRTATVCVSLFILATTLLKTGSADSIAGHGLPYDGPSQTQVVLLGTGTPNDDPTRSGPAVAVVVNEVPYLIDCGPGIVRRCAAAYRKGVTGLQVTKLNRVFVTHLHSDHTVGLPDLMLSPWTLGRHEPLEVFGPPGIKAMVENLANAYAEDVRIRLSGGEPSNNTGFKSIAREVHPGEIYKDQNVRVTAFQIEHGAWRDAYGYRFQTTDRTVVISGDTRPTARIVENCNGCDVLVHEVYSDAGFAKRPGEWQQYHRRYHTSASELADLAGKARPKLLVLYHQLFWGTSEEDLLKEVQSKYSGRVVSAHDLDVF